MRLSISELARKATQFKPVRETAIVTHADEQDLLMLKLKGFEPSLYDEQVWVRRGESDGKQ